MNKQRFNTLRIAGALVLAGLVSGQAMAADGTSTATVITPVSISQTTPLAFGNVVKPSTGDATLTIYSDGSTAPAYSSGAKPGTQAGTVTTGVWGIIGEGTYGVTVSVPSSITLTGVTDNTKTLTVSSLTFNDTNEAKTVSAGSFTTTLSGGSQTIKVGGLLTVPSTATSQAYSGTYSITVAYN